MARAIITSELFNLDSKYQVRSELAGAKGVVAYEKSTIGARNLTIRSAIFSKYSRGVAQSTGTMLPFGLRAGSPPN
jgi:hypothetical protein